MQKLGQNPEKAEPAYVAKYFESVAATSDRPKSVLNSNSAALACYFDAVGCKSTITLDVRRLIEGLIKSGTSEPMVRSKVMPTREFNELFCSWPDNEDLPTDKLRLKCITLMSLCLMLRPSDIAPRSVIVKKTGIKNVQFTANRVSFMENGCAKIRLLGIKNDYHRDGFEVVLLPASERKLCPVRALQIHLKRSELKNCAPDRPVFTPLNYPFAGLSSQSIAAILNKSIELAGLAGRGFSAKSFRPTGATTAVQNNMDPDRVRQTGRWKDEACFQKHYVHTIPEMSMTDVILAIK